MSTSTSIMDSVSRHVREPSALRAYAAELLGTAVLVFFAVGAAVVAGQYIGTLGIALTFGFTLLLIAYALGPISGAHVNPAVTLGALLDRRMDLETAVGYWIAQIVGGIVGAGFLYLLANAVPGLSTHGAFGTTGFGDRSAVRINTAGAFLAELLLTFLLVYVLLCVTRRVRLAGSSAAVPYGLTLAVVSLIGIPLTGASVNPARSIGPALYAGGASLTQIWLFIVAPLCGGVLAAAVYRVVRPTPGDRALALADEDPHGPHGAHEDGAHEGDRLP